MIQEAAPSAKPTDIPPRGWKEILKETWKEAGKDNITLAAAGVAFYAFSALVPLLTAFVLSYGLLAEPSSVVAHVQTLTDVMPKQSAEIIGEQLKTMVESAGTKTGIALWIALFIALYGASKGAGAVMTALNVAWGVRETRSFVSKTLLAIGLCAGSVVVMLLAILSLSAVSFIEALLPTLGGVVHVLFQVFSFALAAVIVMVLLAVVYRYGPNRPEAKWRWITPGSILATIVWLAATAGFGFYVANFGSYNATYGSLGAVIVFLTWLYLSAYIILLGAELNAVLEQQVAAAPTDPEADEGPAVEQKPATPPAVVTPPSVGQLFGRAARAGIAILVLGKDRRRGPA